MRILISPNAFKNSLDAEAAALAIEEGLMQSRLKCECECFPVGDGGDGTGSLILKQLGGRLIETEVHDPLGRIIKTTFGLIDNGDTAIIEMANASGLNLLRPCELNPLHANSYGTGQQIRTALQMGVKKIVIGMGGSATVDGSCGILRALGIRFLDAMEEDLQCLPENLADLVSIDTSALDPEILMCEIIVLCDVENKLLGEYGSATVFGPQKGASTEEVQLLEKSLTKLAAVASQHTGRDLSGIKHGGTAGGAAAGLYAFLNAKLVNGIDYFLELTGFDSALNGTDLVITGEGSIDEQTLQGKGPFGVAKRAKQKGIPVIALAGKVPLDTNKDLQEFFDVLIAIGHEPFDLPFALQSTKKNLIRTSEAIGNLLAIK